MNGLDGMVNKKDCLSRFYDFMEQLHLSNKIVGFNPALIVFLWGLPELWSQQSKNSNIS